MIDKNPSFTKHDWHFIKQKYSQGMDYSGVDHKIHAGSIDDEEISLSHKLAKELIQNTMDNRATLDGEKPEIVFDFSNPPLHNSSVSDWFKGINKALLAGGEIDKKDLKKLGLDTAYPGKGISEDIPYLVVSDFFTTGLEGNWFNDDDAREKNNPNHFFQLQYKIGDSNKNSIHAGSAGVGKKILTNASKIGAYLFHSIRNSDKVALIHGNASLYKHEIQEEKYTREGYWGIETPKEEKNTRPVNTNEPNDISTITKFKKDFNIDRSEEKAGTDFIILMPKDEIEKEIDIIIKTAAVIYTRAFVEEKISLKVIYPDESSVVIEDYDSLIKYIDGQDWDQTKNDPILKNYTESTKYSFKNHIKNIYEQETNPKSHKHRTDFFTIGPLENQNLKGIDKASFDKAFSKHQEEIQTKLKEPDQFVTLKLIVTHEVDKSKIQDSFLLTLQSINQGEQGYMNFVRGITTIPAERKKLDLGLSATIVLDHDNSDDPEKGSIAELLRGFEDGNHLNWDISLSTEKPRYRNYLKLLSLVKKCPSWVSDALEETSTDSDISSAAIDYLMPSKERIRGLSPDITTINKPKKKIKSNPTYWNMHRSDRGIEVSANTNWANAEKDFKDNARIIVTVRHIGADRKTYYIPAEFDFEKRMEVDVRSRRCKYKISGKNTFEFQELQDDFEFKIHNFDAIRDSSIQIDLI